MSIKKLFDLTGKTALITGGSRGLGLQMAEGRRGLVRRSPDSALRRAKLGAESSQCERVI